MGNLIGLLLPPVIQLFNRNVHDKNERKAVAFLLCFVVAIFFNWDLVQHANLWGIIWAFVVTFGESQATFNLYWNDSKPANLLDALINSVSGKFGVQTQLPAEAGEKATTEPALAE